MFIPFQEILKQKHFKFLWFSQILSQITINILNFLLLIRLYDKTGSTIATSFLWVAYALPAIFVGPIAAASVDMLDKKKVLIVTNLLQALTVFFYAYLQESTLFLLYAVVIIYSLLNQFYVPSEASSLPSLVNKKDYAPANGLFLITQQGALLVGFGIAGFLLKIIGFSASIFLCSLFLFIAFLVCLFLPKLPSKDKIPGAIPEAVIKFFSSIKEGYTFIKSEKFVLFPLLLLMAIQISLAIITVNVPALANDIFYIPLDKAGLYIVVPAALGAASGSLIVPRILAKFDRKINIIIGSLKTIILLLLAFIVLPLFLKGDVRNIASFFGLFVLGINFIGVLIPAQTFLQEKTPINIRGRVFGNYWFLVTIATLFPVILSGTITEVLGVRTLIFLLALAYLAGFIYIKVNFSKRFYIEENRG